MTPEERDRLTRLETEFEHIIRKLDETCIKVTEMHQTLTRARGAWLAIGATATIASAITAFLLKTVPFFYGLPK